MHPFLTDVTKMTFKISNLSSYRICQVIQAKKSCSILYAYENEALLTEPEGGW